jgi:hypothetical protein
MGRLDCTTHCTTGTQMTKPADRYQEWADVTGITRNQANSVIALPDKSEVIEYAGLFLQFFTKHFPDSRPPFHVLVVAQQMPNRQPTLMYAMKVFEGFCDGLAELSPSELLQKIADRFGCEIQIGNAGKRLYLEESIESVPNEAMLRGFPPGVRCRKAGPPTHLLMSLLLMRDPHSSGVPGAPDVWKCGLCFALDASEYKPYLDSRGVGKP